jgi:hypothetical protein
MNQSRVFALCVTNSYCVSRIRIESFTSESSSEKHDYEINDGYYYMKINMSGCEAMDDYARLVQFHTIDVARIALE